MTSIPASPAPTPPAPSPTEAAGASKTSPSQDGAGFMALIEALLEGSTPAADGSLDAAVLGGSAESGALDDDSGGEDEPTDLLAGLGLAALVPTPMQLKAAAAEAATGGRGTSAIDTGLKQGLVATEAALLAGSGDGDAGSTPDPDGLFAAVAEAAADDATTAARGASDGASDLNAWAAATHRIAGSQSASGTAATTGHPGLREDVGTQRWREELGARITLMATQGQQSGSLRLSPEHLGPLEIQITVTEDKTANVQFGAQHAETRTALQDALPRLREMFTAAGLTLGDAGVSGQAPRERPADEGMARPQGYDGRSDGEPSPLQRPVRSITHLGLLDTYA